MVGGPGARRGRRGALGGAGPDAGPDGVPPPGTRWITRTIDRSGGSHLTTYTVLEPGAFRGQPAFRVSDAVGTQFYERAGRNWFASVVREKERTGSTPHTGTFAWPLAVGKTWTSTYHYRDNQRNYRFNNVTTSWRVAAEEEVTVPAGRFKALRLEGENNGNRWTVWYVPAIRIVVKEIHERKPGHPSGPGETSCEMVRHAGPGGDPWFGFGLEANAAAVRRGEGRRALAFYEGAAKDFEARGLPRRGGPGPARGRADRPSRRGRAGGDPRRAARDRAPEGGAPQRRHPDRSQQRLPLHRLPLPDGGRPRGGSAVLPGGRTARGRLLHRPAPALLVGRVRAQPSPISRTRGRTSRARSSRARSR